LAYLSVKLRRHDFAPQKAQADTEISTLIHFEQETNPGIFSIQQVIYLECFRDLTDRSQLVS
jgi:hypothetical protein